MEEQQDCEIGRQKINSKDLIPENTKRITKYESRRKIREQQSQRISTGP
jgi:hypothetical protein